MVAKFGLFFLGALLAYSGPVEVVSKVISTSSRGPIYFHGKADDELSINRDGVSVKDLSDSEAFATEYVSKMGRFEPNIVSHTGMRPESPVWVAALESDASETAQRVAKDAYINAKATAYLRDKFCARYGSKWRECFTKIQELAAVEIEKMEMTCKSGEYRYLSGACNHPSEPSLGAALTPYSRILPPAYFDGIWKPRMPTTKGQKGNPIVISKNVVQLLGKSVAPSKATMAMMAWAGVVAYDLAHTSSYKMLHTGQKITCCDQFGRRLSPRYQHPLCLGLDYMEDGQDHCVSYVRSMLARSEQSRFPVAEQMNTATHFLDGSAIYGVSPAAGLQLRSGKNGQLIFEKNGSRATMPCSGRNCILAGDYRWSLGIVPAVIHTIFVKEHNRLAEHLHELNPSWNDEMLYQEARRIVIAQLQHITYSEWLPVLLGPKITENPILTLTHGYSQAFNGSADPSVSNDFANAALKFIPSLMDEHLKLFDDAWKPIGTVPLDVTLVQAKDTEPDRVAQVVRGLLSEKCHKPGLHFPDAVVKHMYGAVGSGTVDGLALDIHRGRDHGLPPYTSYRKLFHLKSTISAPVLAQLEKIYDSLDDVDLVIGGLAETPIEGSLLGPTFSTIIADQMSRTRAADRYFYDTESQPLPFTPDQLSEIKKTTLARLLCDNVEEIKDIQPSAFRPADSKNSRISCESLEPFDLTPWTA